MSDDVLAPADLFDDETALEEVAAGVPDSIPGDDGISHADLKVQTKKFVFQSLFEKSGSVVPSKDILPVLKNFQVEAVAGRVRVVATDLELSVISTTEMVSVSRPGTAVFPAKKMLDIIREAEDGDMLIDVTDGVATITVERASWTLKLQAGDDYPALPEIADVELFPVDRIKFLGAISSVRHAAATNASRPSLMMIDITDGKMTACDGVRFQQADLGEDFPLSMQLPIGAVDDLVKLLRSQDTAEIGVGETDYHLVFKVGNDVFIANKLMAQFPDVEELLLKPALENKHVLVTDRQELKDAIKRVRINADPETSAIILHLAADHVRVASRDKFGNASSEAIDASWSTADRDLVVNHTFLTDMLDMYDGKSTNFLLGEDTKSRKSAVLLKDSGTGTIGIINQMRPDWTVD